MIVVVTMLHVRPIVGEKSLHTTQNNILHHKPMITTDCFLQNETAKNDPNIQAALKNYMLQLQKEEEYRNKLRSGEIKLVPITRWNISDKD
jgi:hypothetical protein